jgi:hypothetical protein
MSGSNVRNRYSSLLSFLKPDGSIDLVSALKWLDGDEELLLADEFSILDCIGCDGAFDLFKFSRWQEEASLLELSLLYSAELIDNSNTTIHRTNHPITLRNSHCMLYQLWRGEEIVVATLSDSLWYLMYVKFSMMNVPKLHKQFR